MKDFFLSDGTCIAKGDWGVVPQQAMGRDEKLYPNASTFDGFRFAEFSSEYERASVQPEGPSQLTEPSETWTFWGSGRLTWQVDFSV